MAAEDGRCVICRRGDESPERGDSPTSVTSLLWTAVAGFLCLALVVGYWKYTDRQEAKRNEALVVADPGDVPVRTPQTAAQPVEGPRPERGGAILEEEDDTATPGEPAQADKALQDAKRAIPIKLYSTSWCPHCKRARAFLKREGYAFEDHDIEASDTDKALLRSINPNGSVPTFDVGGQVVVGFDPTSFDALLTRMAEARLKKPESARR